MTATLYKKSVFVFRRDLRIQDNTGLNQAALLSEKVIPIFNLDPVQIDSSNPYRSENAIQFMVESLQELDNALQKKHGKLYLFYADILQTISHLIKHEKIDALFLNFDYTPFSRKRDEAIEKLCTDHSIAFHGYHDALLIGDPTPIMTGSKTPYTIYTAFYKKVSQITVNPSMRLTKNISFYTNVIAKSESHSIYKKISPSENKHIKVHGGIPNGLKILQDMDSYTHYQKDRNFPALDSTTHLSAHHKFGTISIRESYHTIKKHLGGHSQLSKELYWRDFFSYIAYHYPFIFGHAFRKKYNDIEWSKNKKHFEAWCTGLTGFPIVDAGMRELNETGYMHNRVRMITASFLVKDLHINWQWGERYFAQQLVDYDPAVNNGNWQWAASTGCDAQPYFRIFNPWTQQKKFDPECAYIKKWIPELQNVPNKIIHSWFKNDQQKVSKYPSPIVDHDEARKITLALYKKA